ncbi:MAG: O-antigen ligase family protein [Phycisphaeraceae bacterium]|nr:O-antigen ligase family protein [Phycisphaeraceae bacterium]
MILVQIALFGWVPALAVMFLMFPPRQAVVVSLVSGWLLLPLAGFPLPGLPDYTKVSATCAGVFLAALVFDGGKLLSVRWSWWDVPMAIWVVCPMFSAVSNRPELSLYDGISLTMEYIIQWGMPYWLGRGYFGDWQGIRDLAVGIFAGALGYVPLCAYELKMSPMLNYHVYGFMQSGWTGLRGEGWRPVVFMQNGLSLAMWMCMGAMLGWWLWKTGAVRKVWGMSMGWCVACVGAVALLSRGLGAIALMVLGAGSLWVLGRTRGRWVMWVLIAIAPLYMVLRTTGVWHGEPIGSLAGMVSEGRQQSFEFRLENEDKLVAKALQRTWFGWGGWGRNRVYDEDGNDISVTDGLWVINLGLGGVVGLGAWTCGMLLPVVLFVRRWGKLSWSHPTLAGGAGIAMLLSMTMLDGLMNTNMNPLSAVAAGGMMSLARAKVEREVQASGSPGATSQSGVRSWA